MTPSTRIGRATTGRRIRWLALALMAAGAACASDPMEAEWSTLVGAERLWRERGPDSYAYVFTPVCFCPHQPRRVTVLDGEVAAVEPVPLAEPAPEPLEGYTIDELFDRIRQELARDPDAHRLEFHPTLGYPRDAWFDYEKEAVDEEWGFTVTELTAPTD
jgi:hypothetical protein